MGGRIVKIEGTTDSEGSENTGECSQTIENWERKDATSFLQRKGIGAWKPTMGLGFYPDSHKGAGYKHTSDLVSFVLQQNHSGWGRKNGLEEKG